jgi:NAD(P)-dependent dehydrogenase (short-subunit alcohol dehydrogenase family)
MESTLDGKTILITGATNGIGLVAAYELARMRAHTIIIGRDAQKCTSAVEDIKRETGNSEVEYIVADLSTRAGVQHAAHEFKKRHTRLDVLLNNAGAMFMQRLVTPDGIEMTFALNHLNYFHLTILLLDILKTTGASRVINVSSGAHQGAKMNFDDLQFEKHFQGMTAYGQSKLANILFTYELARKLEGTRVTTNALHPGFVNTGFAKNNNWLVKAGMSLLSPIQRSPKQGAQTSIYLASSPEVESVTGKYFVDSKAVPSDPASYNRASAERLWQISLEMIA